MTLQMFSLNCCDVPESKAVTEKEKRKRSGIVRKMRKKPTSDASWRESFGRRRLRIRRLAELGHCSSAVMCFVSKFQPRSSFEHHDLFCCWCAQQRLKNWELRERKKARDYAKESERDDERRRETVRKIYFCFCLVQLKTFNKP